MYIVNPYYLSGAEITFVMFKIMYRGPFQNGVPSLTLIFLLDLGKLCTKWINLNWIKFIENIKLKLLRGEINSPHLNTFNGNTFYKVKITTGFHDITMQFPWSKTHNINGWNSNAPYIICSLFSITYIAAELCFLPNYLQDNYKSNYRIIIWINPFRYNYGNYYG